MSDSLISMVEILSKRIQKKKDSLIMEKIIAYLGPVEDFSIAAEAQRKFPRLRCEINRSDSSETWWWNDGSAEGKRLITFFVSDVENLYDEKAFSRTTFGFHWR